MMRDRRSKNRQIRKKTLLILFFIALLLRVVFLLYVEMDLLQDREFKYGDEKDYHYKSWGLSQGYNLRINKEKIGYYALVTGIYYLFGPHKISVLLFQCILGSVTCLLVYFLARGIYSHEAGLIAWFLCTIYPPLIWWCGFLLKETAIVFLMVAMLFTAFKAGRSPTIRRFLIWVAAASGAGIFLAIMRLTFLSFIPLLILWIIFSAKEWKAVLFRILGILALAGLIGLVLHLSLASSSELTMERIEPRRIIDRWLESFNSPSERFIVENLGWMELYKHWRSRPWTFLKRVGLVWRAFAERPLRDPVSIITGCLYLALIPFFFYGLACAFIRNPKDALLLFLLLFIFTVVHLFTLPRLRFRIQMMPLVLILAAIGLSDTLAYLKSLVGARRLKRKVHEKGYAG